jgi:hypothetical protein
MANELEIMFIKLDSIDYLKGHLSTEISNKILHLIRWEIGFTSGLYDISKHVKTILSSLIIKERFEDGKFKKSRKNIKIMER